MALGEVVGLSVVVVMGSMRGVALGLGHGICAAALYAFWTPLQSRMSGAHL